MHILIFGDSITQGYDDYVAGGWVNRLFIDISARQDKNNHDYVSVFNLGIDGDTTEELLVRVEAEIKCRKDSDKLVIVFDIGGNDAARRGDNDENTVSHQLFTKNYQTLVQIGKKYGVVACLGLHESDGVLDEEDYVKYNDTIERLAKENTVTYISMKGILSVDFERLTYDGDHPSPDGHQLIYTKVKQTLIQANIL